jgi:uncharacterized protein (TIGR03435 family)
MRRVLQLLARLYPAEWRARYGAEYAALLEERDAVWRDVVDVAWAAVKLWATSWSFVRVVLPCVLAGGLVAVALLFAMPMRYSSQTVVTVMSTYEPPKLVDESGQTVVLAHERHEPQDRLFFNMTEASFDRDYLASVIHEKNLYPRERASMPPDDVIEKMRRAIRVIPVARSRSADEDLSSYAVQFDYADPHVAQQVDRALISRLMIFTLRSAIKRTATPSSAHEVFRVDEAPSFPLKPAGPNRIELGAIGLFGGLVCGVVVSALAGSRLGRVAAVGLVLLGTVGGVAARGQDVVHASGPLPSFEVATIKPDRGGPPPPPMPVSNEFRNFNVTARDLVRVAYGLPPSVSSTRVFGGPGWIDSNRYDVVGKIPDAAFASMQKLPARERGKQISLMLQALLADRFKLMVHFETREMAIYELVVAKGEAKLTLAKEVPTGLPLPPPGNPPRPEDMRQGLMVLRKAPGVMEMTAKGQTLDALAQQPFFSLGSPVVNKTGLTDKYDFVLDWSPDQAGADVLTDAASLFTALQEQLGLKLVQTKGQVEVVVIEHIELPSEN